jgi:hypothetical protein
MQAFAIALAGSIGVSAASAQVLVASFDELRRELHTGDFLTIVGADGQAVAGHLVRIGGTDLVIRAGRDDAKPGGGDVTMPFHAIQSLERPRDTVGNGVRWGASVGAVSGGGFFLTAFVIDRNEMDEWAGPYAGAAAILTGVGALIGWAIDAAASKPHLRFDVQPSSTRGRGVSIALRVRRNGGSWPAGRGAGR